jgi:hypothetical protein
MYVTTKSFNNFLDFFSARLWYDITVIKNCSAIGTGFINPLLINALMK